VSKFYVISGRNVPVLMVDEDGEPAAFDTAEEARTSASVTPMCRAMGFIVIEMNEHGPVGEVP
jgi:hypothetical protein